jgi:chromosome segregation ATPase
MIGLALHLGACALDRVVAEVEEARRVLDWCLAFTAPSLEEQVERLGAECDALRAERDKARARVAELRGILRESRALTHEAEGERDDARTLAHEAKLEFSAAREACEQLRAQLDELRAAARDLLAVLADWRGIAASEQREAAEVRAQLDELRAAARDLLAVADRSAIRCSSCSNAAAAVDKTYAYCDEHMPPNQGQLRELSYAAAMRRGRALLPEVKP